VNAEGFARRHSCPISAPFLRETEEDTEQFRISGIFTEI
jgi:hypothetical protein